MAAPMSFPAARWIRRMAGRTHRRCWTRNPAACKRCCTTVTSTPRPLRRSTWRRCAKSSRNAACCSRRDSTPKLAAGGRARRSRRRLQRDAGPAPPAAGHARARPWSRWITPLQALSSPGKRFDTHFFIASAPARQDARHDAHEAVQSAWMRPRAALESYWRGEIVLAPPQVMSLAHLARHSGVDAMLAEADSPPALRGAALHLRDRGHARHRLSRRRMPSGARSRHARSAAPGAARPAPGAAGRLRGVLALTIGVMEFLTLTALILFGAYLIKSREQKRRVALLASHLGNYQIEHLMEKPDRGLPALPRRKRPRAPRPDLEPAGHQRADAFRPVHALRRRVLEGRLLPMRA